MKHALTQRTDRPKIRNYHADSAIEALKKALDHVLQLRNEVESYRAGNKKRSFTKDDAWVMSELAKVIGCFYQPRNKLECMQIFFK